MKSMLMMLVVLAVAVSAQANLVPNGDFQTIVKPGTTIAATIQDGEYFNIPSQTMHAGAIANYADGTSVNFLVGSRKALKLILTL